MTPIVEETANGVIADLTDKPITIEGALSPSILAGLLPIPLDAHKLYFLAAPSPEGFSLRTAGERGDGLGLTLDVGLDTVDHPCVPPVADAPILRAGPTPILTGYDHQGEVYQLGLALPAATLDRALWTLWRSGLLCLALDTDQIAALTGQRIDTAALGLFLPGLDRLAGGPRRMMIAVDPRFTAAEFPVVRLAAMADDGGVPQLGLDVALHDVGVSLYAEIEDRWTRVFAARTDVRALAVVRPPPTTASRSRSPPPRSATSPSSTTTSSAPTTSPRCSRSCSTSRPAPCSPKGSRSTSASTASSNSSPGCPTTPGSPRSASTATRATTSACCSRSPAPAAPRSPPRSRPPPASKPSRPAASPSPSPRPAPAPPATSGASTAGAGARSPPRPLGC
ncbi:MAG: hypothetical protein H6705_01000 [Myxococcales bacterium]|nr:hypothetical protein [Myxococcales bacterium]